MTIFALGALLMADSALPVVLAGKVLFGLGLPWILVAALTLLQRSTPPHLQGRAFAASELALGAPQTLSIALGAALVALVDYRFVLLVQAATVGLAGVYVLTRMQASWRPWTMTSTTSWWPPTARRETTRGRWWRRWRRSAPKP
jgi:MFS family permease